MRVLVVGMGAVGVVFAEFLARNDDVEVSAVARSNYEALAGDGIRIVTNYNGDRTFKPKHAYTPQQIAEYSGEPFDFVVVATKVTADAKLPPIAKCLGKDSVIFLAQNGVDIEEPYIEAFPGVPIASAVLRLAASIKSPTEIHHYFPHLKIEAGVAYPPSGEVRQKAEKSLEEFKTACAKGGIDFETTATILRNRWEKLLWNGTFNTICAAADLDMHQVFDAGMEGTIRNVMYEIWDVARAALGPDGDWVARTRCDELVEHTRNLPRTGFLPSTLQDVRRGVEIEYETLCGNAVRAGRRLGVPVPHLEMLYDMLKATNFRILLAKQQTETGSGGRGQSKA